MSTKCKIFKIYQASRLEKSINDFLEKNPDIEVLKVNQLFDPDEPNGEDLIILIFYKEPRAVKTKGD